MNAHADIWEVDSKYSWDNIEISKYSWNNIEKFWFKIMKRITF